MPTRETKRPPRRALVVGVGALVVVALVTGLVWAIVGGVGQQQGCTKQVTLRMYAAPEMQRVFQPLLAKPAQDGSVCYSVQAEYLESAPALGAITNSWVGRPPEIWIPDSSVWLGRIQEHYVKKVANLTSTPLVIGASLDVVTKNGWAARPPTWSEVLDSKVRISLPDLYTSTESLAALAAIQVSKGGGPAAQAAVIETYLKVEKGEVPTAYEAMSAATEGSPDAPLLPITEQDLLQANRTRQDSKLVALYPRDGAPLMDYPVLAVGDQDGETRNGVQAVAKILSGPFAQEAYRAEGFRVTENSRTSSTLSGSSSTTGPSRPGAKAMELDPAMVRGMFNSLLNLRKPSRILALIDVSSGMNRSTGSGSTAAQLAQSSTTLALQAFAPETALGVWLFASGLGPGQPHVEIAPPVQLSTVVDGRTQTQKDLLKAAADRLPQTIMPGSSTMYQTLSDAMNYMRNSWDPTASNTIVVLCGTPNNAPGPSLDDLVRKIDEDARKFQDKPIRIIAVGIGPGADKAALQRISQAAGEPPYQADSKDALNAVLVDALGRRK